MKYTKAKLDTFETLTVNAGIVTKNFDPKTGELSDADIIGSTSGGISINISHNYKDWGEDIDGCKKNTKELKRLDSTEIAMSGTLAAAGKDTIKTLIAVADIAEDGHIALRNDLKETDFLDDLWLVADYGKEDGGYIAVDMKNALSTGGLSLQTTDKEKGKFAFTFTAHCSLKSQDDVPCEIWISETAPVPGA